MNWFKWFVNRGWEVIPHKAHFPLHVLPGDTVILDGERRIITTRTTFPDQAALAAYIQEHPHG